MANGNDIIIKGGSVDLIFDDAVFPPAGKGSHIARYLNLKRIVVTNQSGQTVYDSGSEDIRGWMISVMSEPA